MDNGKWGVKDVHHYLDNFITVGPPESPQCQQNLAGIILTCQDTGTPLDVRKCEGPLTTITFLGMMLDTQAMEIRLPEKLSKLRKMLSECEQCRAGKKRHLLSLIGFLQHAAKSCTPGSLIPAPAHHSVYYDYTLRHFH